MSLSVAMCNVRRLGGVSIIARQRRTRDRQLQEKQTQSAFGAALSAVFSTVCGTAHGLRRRLVLWRAYSRFRRCVAIEMVITRRPAHGDTLSSTMEFRLSERLRIDTEVVNGRGITRAFIGERELRVDGELLLALLELARGGRPTSAQLQLLIGHQVLTPSTPPSELVAEGAPAFIALSPVTAIDWSPVPRVLRGATVTPESSLPIGMFVPPQILHPLQRLAETLRAAWGYLLRAAHSRGTLVEPQAAEGILVAICEDVLRNDAVLAELFTVQRDPFRLVPRHPLQEATLQYSLEELRLLPDRAPQRELRPFRWSFPPALTPTVARWFGWLSHGLSRAELAHKLREAPPIITQLLHLLRDRGLLTLSAAPPTTRSLQPGEIMHLGHATLLANLGGQHVLFDPWFPPASVTDRVRPPSCAELPPLAGIFITHHHWDHVNLETLLKLRKDIPIYVPRQPTGSVLAPRTAQLLAQIGFEQMRELGHDEQVTVGQGGTITAVPFFGEDPTRLHFGANCYVLTHGEHSALVHVDSGTDSEGRSLISSGIAESLVARFGPLSPLLATRRQERGMMIEHTWEFLLQPAQNWVRATENCCNDAAFLAALTTACKSRQLVLYSEGGADFYPASTDFLRRPGSPSRMAPHEYLWDSLETITQAVEKAGATLHLSNPYHAFRIGGESSNESVIAR